MRKFVLSMVNKNTSSPSKSYFFLFVLGYYSQISVARICYKGLDFMES